MRYNERPQDGQSTGEKMIRSGNHHDRMHLGTSPVEHSVKRDPFVALAMNDERIWRYGSGGIVPLPFNLADRQAGENHTRCRRIRIL